MSIGVVKGVAIVLLLLSTASMHAAQSIQFEVVLVVNKAEVGNIDAEIIDETVAGEKNTRVNVPPERLRTLVDKFANEDQNLAWFGSDEELTVEGEPSPSEKISLYDLRMRGLDIYFDAGDLTINATVPRLGTQNVSLRGNRQPIPQDHYQQARFASGLNARARSRYNHQATPGREAGFDSTSVDITGFTSIGGFGGVSLFYEGNYTSDEEQRFVRQDVTLIHDNFKRGLRYSIGDIQPSVSSFQTSPSMLGFSVERNYLAINPFRNLSSRGQSRFTLDRAATVSFQVNGVVVETRRLEPGDYSIEDFPFSGGTNDVVIFTDDGQRIAEIARFSNYVDIDLLDPGITNFGVSAGVLRRFGTGRSRRYENDPAILAYYETGINQRLTLGAQAEFSETHALIASNAIFGTRLGLFAAEAAVSKRDEHDTGYSALLRYDFGFEFANDWVLSSNLQGRYKSADFLSLSDTDIGTENWSIDTRTSIRKGRLGLSLGMSVLENDGLQRNRFSATLSQSYAGYNMSLGYQYNESDAVTAQDDANLLFTISKNFSNSTIGAGYRSDIQEASADWVGGDLQHSGDLQGRVRVATSERFNTGTASLAYIGSRFEANAIHSTAQATLPTGIDRSTTELSLAGSVGFADGQLAFGRPFRQGFMVVSPHETLRGKKVFVGRREAREATITTTKRLRSTLVPIDNSYRKQRYAFDVDELPFGYDLGSGEVELYPGHLSGYKYTLGSDAANTIMGKVVWPGGTPLSLISGQLVPEDAGQTITIFTNRTGRFVAEKVKFGRYQLVFKSGDKNYTVPVHVAKKDEPGLVQVGTLKLQKSP